MCLEPLKCGGGYKYLEHIICHSCSWNPSSFDICLNYMVILRHDSCYKYLEPLICHIFYNFPEPLKFDSCYKY